MQNHPRRSAAVVLLLLAAAGTIPPAHAGADGTWTLPSSGDWSDAATANWADGAVAGGAGGIAWFNTLDLPPAATWHVKLAGPRTIGQLHFGDIDADSNGAWLLSGSQLTLDHGSSTPEINADALGPGAAVTIASVLAGSNGFIKTGPGELRLTATNLLSTSASPTSAVTVDDGTLRLTGSGTLLNVTRFAVNRGGLLVLDNSATNLADNGSITFGRFKSGANPATIKLRGGGLTYVGHATDANLERLDTIIVSTGGHSTISVTGTAGGTSKPILRATHLTREAGGNGILILTTPLATPMGSSSSAPRLTFSNMIARDGTSAPVHATANRFLGGWALQETSAGLPAFAVHQSGNADLGVRAMAANDFGAGSTTNNFNSVTNTTAYAAGNGNDNAHFLADGSFATTALSANRFYESFTSNVGTVETNTTITIADNISMTLNSGGLLRSQNLDGQRLTIDGPLGRITAGNTYGGNHNLIVHAGAGAVSGGFNPGIIINALIVDNGPNAVTLQTMANGSAAVTLGNSANSYSGGTIINKGILSVGADGALGAADGDVTLAGGTLRWTGPTHAWSAGRAITTTGPTSAIDIADAGTILTVDNGITGAGGIQKRGAGTLVLDGAGNAYEQTRVEEGMMVLAGMLLHTDGAGGGGMLRVDPNGTLMGDGSYSSTHAEGLRVDGVLAPGMSVGTLTAGSNVWFRGEGAAAVGELRIEVEGASIDRVVGISQLRISPGSAGGTTRLAIVGELVEPAYVIAEYATLHPDENQFASVDSVTRQGYAVNYGHAFLEDGIDKTGVALTAIAWAGEEEGQWSTAGAWKAADDLPAAAPNGPGATARFNGAGTGGVNVDGEKTIGRLILEGVGSIGYSIGGSDLIFNNAGGFGDDALIKASGGEHVVNSRVVMGGESDLEVHVAAGAGVELAGGIDNAEGKTLSKTGGGSVTLGGYVAPAGTAVHVNAGTLISGGLGNASLTIGLPAVDLENPPAAAGVKFAAAVGPLGSTLQLDDLVINPTGLLDITDNRIQLNYAGESPFNEIVAAILSGRNGGTWDGAAGITSSLATGATAIGVVDNGADVTFAYTLGADSNLDYAVNFDDLLVLAQYYGATGTAVWANGDFNYDTDVNFDDLLLLAQLYGDTLPALSVMESSGFSAAFASDVQSAFAAVPEPGTVGLLAVAALGLLGRRRRQRA